MTEKIPGVRHILAMSSGKGGVGKSTASVNLALALQNIGYRVGISDVDIFGPSIPVMLGLRDERPMMSEDHIIPLESYGLQVISMGLLVDPDTPAIFRGPMVTKFLHQLVFGVAWKNLDYLVLDLPPGTGDTQLSLAQSIPLTGAIVVTTPQDVSFNVALKGLRMFEKVKVPILGILENMSSWTCEQCGHTAHLFSQGGGQRLAELAGVPYLGGIPLDREVVLGGDCGKPIVTTQKDSPASKAYQAVAHRLEQQIGKAHVSLFKPFKWVVSSGQGDPGWHEERISADGSQTLPVGFKLKSDSQLSILWADGTQHDFDFRGLRLACPCAVCVDENTGKRLLSPSMVPMDIYPYQIESVGTYAIAFTWSDGHRTGIYALERLRKIGETSLR